MLKGDRVAVYGWVGEFELRGHDFFLRGDKATITDVAGLSTLVIRFPDNCDVPEQLRGHTAYVHRKQCRKLVKRK